MSLVDTAFFSRIMLATACAIEQKVNFVSKFQRFCFNFKHSYYIRLVVRLIKINSVEVN